ncbi:MULTISPECIES: hypothetical protein [Streptomyces diastaticus group]|uniref:DUF3093 domain-containing protein n=1 Tax=Streptomyces gougerotii TaxID=53448 RepID=A0A8H9HPT3_9ACTN|nr:hypothetical protein [Streptomyces gougerotii]GFH80188.1 hypothetical protein Sgou_48580 [Streptomyces gougerotii]GGU77459.1 hypothetical protein GCM10010227_34550 [Streptomyces gougerotii]
MDQPGQHTPPPGVPSVDLSVTYQEDPPRTWTRICLAAYALWAAYQAFQLLPDERTAWLVVCAMSLLLLLCLLAVPLSKRLYHRIRLADGELRVGRERLPVASLTLVSLTAAAHEPGRAGLREYRASLTPDQLKEARRRTNALTRPRLVGGAWAVPVGMEELVVETVEGASLAIATRDRAGLLGALTRARGEG